MQFSRATSRRFTLSVTSLAALFGLLVVGLAAASSGCGDANADGPSATSKQEGRDRAVFGHKPPSSAQAPTAATSGAPTWAQDRGLNPQVVASLRAWLGRMVQVPLGAAVDAADVGNPMYVTDDFGLGPDDPFLNLGFVRDPHLPGRWVRLVDIDAAAGVGARDGGRLVLSAMPELPNIDCVAISTIGRREDARVYLYDTLRSLFANFPAGLEVNVLVGNKFDQHVSEARLAAEFAPSERQRIHIFRTEPSVSDALAQMSIAKRGGWNFARGLLKYDGHRGIVLLEDDVAWATGSAGLLTRAVGEIDFPVVSLYNNKCEDLPERRQVASAGPLGIDVPSRAYGFHWFSQGFWVRGDAAKALGEHYLVHLNGFCWDKLLNYFLLAHNLDVGYTFPSLLQHRGFVSTGPWGAHESACFLGDRMAEKGAPGGGP